MSESEFPASVHVLRPRKVSVSERLDNFLDEEGLASSGTFTSIEATRPLVGKVNAIVCADCGQIEYLTRNECRCGHYLRGQLEDEYLAWEKKILAEYAELSETVELKLRPLRISYLLAVPFMLIPVLKLTLMEGGFDLGMLLWWSPAMLLAGAGLLAETHVIRPLKEQAWFVENHTFETFIERRLI
jgi:hypothetical protein